MMTKPRRRAKTTTIIEALRILQRDIQSDDGIANAAIGEAADRLVEFVDVLGDCVVQHGDAWSPRFRRRVWRVVK